MEQQGLRRKDLEPLLGIAAEVLIRAPRRTGAAGTGNRSRS